MTARIEYEEHRLAVTRTARWGALGERSARTGELWFVLHGYGQLAAPFAASTSWPVEPNRAFVFPEALQRFYEDDASQPRRTHADAPVGANWMTREAREDDIADNLAYLDALLARVRADAPNAAFVVLGFSQGAATATRWAAARAAAGDPPSRLILWAGVVPPDVDLGPNAPLRRVPIRIVFGTHDHYAPSERIAAERARFQVAGFPASVERFEGGHRLDDATLARIASVAPAG